MTDSVARAFIFDVDGVLNNPENKTSIKNVLIQKIIDRLNNNEPIFFVTGRTTDWFEKWILNRIKTGISDRNLLSNLYLSAEFGNISFSFEQGKAKIEINSAESVPQSIIKEARKITESYFSDSMSVNNAQTFFSTEIKDGVSFEKFKNRQKEAADAYRDLLLKKNNSESLIVYEDLMGTNILHRGMGKALGITKIIKWLTERKLKPEKYIVFGDSLADLEMGSELQKRKLNFDFVYVGENGLRETAFKLIRTDKKYDEGTLEYLKSLNF